MLVEAEGPALERWPPGRRVVEGEAVGHARGKQETEKVRAQWLGSILKVRGASALSWALMQLPC